MPESAYKVPVKMDVEAPRRAPSFHALQPFESLDRAVIDADPFWGRELTWRAGPAVDIAEKQNSYEVTAELPGVDEKGIEVKLANGCLMIKGEKQEQKEEKQRDYYLCERRFGSFERRFAVPLDVDADKIVASFEKGVLTVTLPKMPAGIIPEKKIDVKAA